MDYFNDFVGIYFYKESWAVVPKHWLFICDGILKCYWPQMYSNVEELAKGNIQPDPTQWSIWPVMKVQETSSEYV